MGIVKKRIKGVFGKMFYKFVESEQKDGSYELLLTFNGLSTEFGLDILSKDNLKEYGEKVKHILENEAKGLHVKNIKIVVAGAVIASMTLQGFLDVHAADRFSMSYLYFGTTAKQIEYVTRTNGSLDVVSPSYFDINPDGSLKINTISKEFVDQMHAQGIKVVPFISNHWNRAAGVSALKNVDGLANQIANAVSTYNLDGVNIDLENLTVAERIQYVEFTKALRTKIPKYKEVSVAVAANPNGYNNGWQGSYDYAALAANSDYLMIMAYDESFETGSAGPVASLPFVERSIQYALTKTTPDKVVVGLPFYGRLWGGNGRFDGDGLSVSSANSILSKYNAEVTYDVQAKSPKATFTVKSGDVASTVNGQSLVPGTYTLWYENDQSLQEKLALIEKYDIKGAGSWALGQENVSLWSNYTTWLENPIGDGSNQGSFRDVLVTDWFYKATEFLRERHIIDESEQYFRPNQIATRAECVAWLMDAYGIEPDSKPINSFSDVSSTSKYAGYISAAKRLGITSGIGNDKFAPERQLTREEMFTLLHNTFNQLGENLYTNPKLTIEAFDDSGQVSSWAREELDTLVKGGIITGMGDNKLMPKQKATRAQLAQVVYELLK